MTTTSIGGRFTFPGGTMAEALTSPRDDSGPT